MQYKITIINWEKHNPSSKRGYTHFMLSKSIFSDNKVSMLSAREFQLWLYLITLAADMRHQSYILNTNMVPKCIHIRANKVHTSIMRLQELQLVTAEILSKNCLNRIENNRIEEKVIENNRIEKNTTNNKLLVVSGTGEEEQKLLSDRPSKAQPRGCIDEFSHDEVCLEFLSNVTHKAQKSWLSAYPSVDWICHEVRKANAWCETNSHKAPKDKGKFMLNWLSRGFEDYRKSLQSKNVYDPNAALREKLEREERMKNEKNSF